MIEELNHDHRMRATAFGITVLMVVVAMAIFPAFSEDSEAAGGLPGTGVEEPFTVTFDSNGGSYVPTQFIENGFVVAPEDPVLAGYVFGGWYTVDDVPFDFSQPISGDITLYAVWVETLVFTTSPTSSGNVSAVQGLDGTILYDATGSSDYSSILWDLGDGAVSTNTYVTHSYANPGTYTVTLTVFNENGSDTTTFTVDVPEGTAEGGGDSDLLLYIAVGLLALIAGGLVVRRFL